MRREITATALAVLLILAGCQTCREHPTTCAIVAGLALGCAFAAAKPLPRTRVGQ